MKNLTLMAIGIPVMALVSGCRTDQKGPIEKDSEPPGEIKNITVEALPGGAKMKYTLPSDPDLLYVLAEYSNKTGRRFDFKSSYYLNFLVINGFAEVSRYEVKMYAVDRSGNRSIPSVVPVTPDTPPVVETYNSLRLKPDFGGIRISFKNPSKAELAIVASTPDLEGKMAKAITYHTSMDSGNFALRGYEPKPRKFEVYVKDRWDNTSDVLQGEFTPIYEVRLDKTKFKKMLLPGDYPEKSWSGDMSNIWDDKMDESRFHSGNAPSNQPKMFTFDLGVETRLSRFSLQTIPNDHHWFADITMKRYEIWGTVSLDHSGSLDGWTKLIEVTSIKPSGLPFGELTGEDREAGRRGDEGNFLLTLPKVRYIRIRCLENWSGNTNIVISEITFWGTE